MSLVYHLTQPISIIYNMCYWARAFLCSSVREREIRRMMKKPAKPISFSYNHSKTPQVALWLLHRHGGSMDKLKLVKMVFLADREHLIRYGRPIVGGHYFTMRRGPVSSEFKEYVDCQMTGVELPFALNGQFNLVATQPVDENWLSPSDREILDTIYYEYKDFSPIQLANITHQFKAYKKHVPEAGSRCPIPYEDFFEDSDSKDMLALVLEEQEIRDL